MKKTTIKSAVSLSGVGLHSGESTTINIKPADVNHGIKFSRTDLPDETGIIADVSYVTSTARGTTIQKGAISISTIEHLLSAIAGAAIDNLLIEVDGPEIPIMDGSAAPFYDALIKAGIEEQEDEKEYFVIEEPISFYHESTGASYTAFPDDKFVLTTMISFNDSIIGSQYAELSDLSDYRKDIAACRTFVFVDELEILFKNGLIRGGDLSNAVVISKEKLSEERVKNIADKLGKDPVEIKEEGVVNNSDLFFNNEPARHKLLDVVGDLCLLGRPIKGRIFASKPGHEANVAFTKILKQKFIEQRKLKGKPFYDPTKKPVYDVNQVQGFLPHRYPFLMVDKIIEISDTLVVGVKSVTMNENFFQGHFPGNPVFPGVLQMEALAQTGGILALTSQEDPGNWDTYFLKMDNVKFKHMVVPGDTLILKMELLSPIRRGIVHMQGTAYVGNHIVSEGELTAQIVRRG